MIESRVLEVAPHGGHYTNYHKARRRSLFFFLYVDYAVFVSLFSLPPSPPLSVEYYAVQWSILSVYLSVLFIFVRPQAVC